MDFEVLIPLAPFLMVAAIVWFASREKARTNEAMQQTMRAAIDKGTELTPETVKAMGMRPRRPQTDLRAGLILVAVALGLVVMGTGINAVEPDEGIVQIMAGVSAIPGFIGIALLLMHFFLKKENDD